MAPMTEYKLISGTDVQINGQLPTLTMQGWKPILLAADGAKIVVMLEHQPGAGAFAQKS